MNPFLSELFDHGAYHSNKTHAKTSALFEAGGRWARGDFIFFYIILIFPTLKQCSWIRVHMVLTIGNRTLCESSKSFVPELHRQPLSCII